MLTGQSVLNHEVDVNGLMVHHGMFYKDPHMSYCLQSQQYWACTMDNVKEKLPLLVVSELFIILNPNCQILLSPYAVRVVQSASSFSSVLPLESNIAGHCFLKIYIDMIFAPTPVPFLHFTSMGGPLLLSFVSSGHILILVKACDLSRWCMLWIDVAVEP